MGLTLKKIHGDSLVIINWACGKSDLSSIDLAHWCAEFNDMIHYLASVDIIHVFGEDNQRSDCLSKDALLLELGHCVFFLNILMTLCVRVVQLSSFESLCRSFSLPFL